MTLPEWMTIKPASTEKYGKIKETISGLGLHTVCAEAHCPNITECWGSGTATFMVLGSACTRGCRFCAVSKMARGEEIDRLEPAKLASVIKEWKLNYVVITSVCRDDLPDQGSAHFANCVAEIRKENPKTMIELLIPDFRDDAGCLKLITDSRPDVIGHNIETVERLTPTVRDRRASYKQSINVLKKLKELDGKIYTKSAIMLGIGETEDEVISAMRDLRVAGVDFLAIGQYLSPSQHHLKVKEYIRPEKFEHFKKIGTEMGFLYVAAGPFVRSSYKAGEFFMRRILAR
jgi:lipoic acid synthetase